MAYPQKILYSPNYGAGWASENLDRDPEQIKFMLQFEPMIKWLESGKDFSDLGSVYGIDEKWTENNLDVEHPLRLFVKEWQKRWPDQELPYLGGFDGLAVKVVYGPFTVEEYDGYESVIEAMDMEWIDL